MANSGKKAGASYESRFAAEAISRGFDVHHPIGDYLPYDYILTNDRDGSFRVQVKGTVYRQKGKRAFKVLAATGKGGAEKVVLSKDEVDVLAAYVAPALTWYLIPIEKVTSKSVLLSPLDESSVGQYEPWREAWNVFA